MKYLNLIFSISSILSISSISAAPTFTSRCGDGYGECDPGFCCSEFGWCGKSDDYCLISNNCQPKFGKCTGGISTDDRCGPQNGYTICPSGECCSQYGWCGTEGIHCGTGCQSEFGQCNNFLQPTLTFNTIPPSTTTNISSQTTKSNTSLQPTSIKSKCGVGYGECDPGFCCSVFGWCGQSDDHCLISNGCQSEFGKCIGGISTNNRCGPQNGYTVCPSGECCSQYGWCGTESIHCGAGCQSEFGQCN
ncbi:hypothetical protein BCR36DRAFT_308236, partial [Piromyces finnis]